MLEVRDIRKAFGGFTAVAGVSLTVPERGITAVIGPNRFTTPCSSMAATALPD